MTYTRRIGVVFIEDTATQDEQGEAMVNRVETLLDHMADLDNLRFQSEKTQRPKLLTVTVTLEDA